MMMEKVQVSSPFTTTMVTSATKIVAAATDKKSATQSHYIYIGLQASSGAYCTDAHKAFQKAVKIWQCREGRSKLTRQELKKKGKLSQVVQELLTRVRTKTGKFPELFYRPNTKTCVKIDLKAGDDNKLFEKVLREYLLGNRGNFLRVSLLKAKEQLGVFQEDVSAEDYTCLVRTLKQLREDIENDPLSTPKHLLKVKESGYLALLNTMLAEALKTNTSGNSNLDHLPEEPATTSTGTKQMQRTISHGSESSRDSLVDNRDGETPEKATAAGSTSIIIYATKQQQKKRKEIQEDDSINSDDDSDRSGSSGNNNDPKKQKTGRREESMEIASVMLDLSTRPLEEV